MVISACRVLSGWDLLPVTYTSTSSSNLLGVLPTCGTLHFFPLHFFLFTSFLFTSCSIHLRTIRCFAITVVVAQIYTSGTR